MRIGSLESTRARCGIALLQRARLTEVVDRQERRGGTCSGDLVWWLPGMPSIAGKLTPRAPTLTRMWPGPGAGLGTSSSFRLSMGP